VILLISASRAAGITGMSHSAHLSVSFLGTHCMTVPQQTFLILPSFFSEKKGSALILFQSSKCAVKNFKKYNTATDLRKKPMSVLSYRNINEGGCIGIQTDNSFNFWDKGKAIPKTSYRQREKIKADFGVCSALDYTREMS
jgi:hypothetical protein